MISAFAMGRFSTLGSCVLFFRLGFMISIGFYRTPINHSKQKYISVTWTGGISRTLTVTFSYLFYLRFSRFVEVSTLLCMPGHT